MRTFCGVLLVMICLFLTACNQSRSVRQRPPEAIEGVMDLRDWDFEKDGSINLAGEWAFFWQELLDPDQITHPDQASYVSVPDIWSNYDIEGTTITAEGYATYYLAVSLPDAYQTYGLYIEGQGSAYSLCVDGRLLATNGQVGTSSQAMTPEKKPITVFFQPGGETVVMVVQVSNFHHRKGGFRNNLLLGLAETVHQFQMRSWFVEAFFVGILFIMGLYHLSIYAFRSKDRAALYFALLCWAAAVRIGVTGQHILLFHLPSISWFLEIRVEYLTFFLVPPMFILFLHSLYPKDVPRLFIQVVLGLGIGFSLFVLFADTLTASYTPQYYQIAILLGVAYGLYLVGRIIVRRREGGLFVGIATSVWFATVVIETLYFRNLLPFGKVAPYGFLAFIFVQAVLLASRFSRSFQRVETLSIELEEVNASLQHSEGKYRHIFEDSKDIIFIAGRDTRIEDVSPSCEEVLGYTKKELQQMEAREVMVNPAALSRFRNDIFGQGSIKNIEIELRRKDGQKIDALVTATLRRDESGETTGFQGSVRDVTAIRDAETERVRSLKLEQIAITDPLTGIYNRRFFDEGAKREIERAKRKAALLSIVIFDIDQFKSVNDTYGHLTGDQVLITLADICQRNIRKMDLFARFGGDEFVILLPDASQDAALETAEKLRQLVADQPMRFGEREAGVTISLGLASGKLAADMEIGALLDKADQALYRSKENGRNQVTVWREGDGIAAPSNMHTEADS